RRARALRQHVGAGVAPAAGDQRRGQLRLPGPDRPGRAPAHGAGRPVPRDGAAGGGGRADAGPAAGARAGPVPPGRRQVRGAARVVLPVRVGAPLLRAGGAVRKWWRWLGSGVLLGVVGWRVDWAQVGAAFARMHWPLWALALALYLAT